MAAPQPGYCCFESNNYKIQTTHIFKLKAIQLLKAKTSANKKAAFQRLLFCGYSSNLENERFDIKVGIGPHNFSIL